jgi:hypothetical protein
MPGQERTLIKFESLQTIINALVANPVIVATYAEMVSDSVGKSARFYQVTADETNSGETTLYWWNGTKLNWVVTQEE